MILSWNYRFNTDIASIYWNFIEIKLQPKCKIKLLYNTYILLFLHGELYNLAEIRFACGLISPVQSYKCPYLRRFKLMSDI